VLALEKRPAPEDVAPLGKAFATSQGDISGEIAFNVLEALGAIGGEGVQRVLERAASDRRPHVRRVARRVLRSRFGVDLPPEPRAPFADDGPIPVPGVDYPRWQQNPMAEVRTSRGTMVFELFPAEAPIHVYNFLTLAEAGHYDDLLFHRVVPDFVIQGGDYRGDGNGGAPWRGDALRNEFGRRKFLRGSLGMPRNEDPDSGGSQFFVTQRPTPHLDGRYTLFGQLRTGGEVLDRVEVGDRILSVRLIRR
jgi:cyclophilin family peptidyl-prolyl cis-trans isomerase